MATYSAAEIVGKGLTAKKAVNMYTTANDTAKPVGVFQPKTYIGVVYSWLAPDPSKGRAHLYWQFINSKNLTYYVRHDSTAFDVGNLKAQGTKSEDEKTKEAAEAAAKEKKGAIAFYIEKYAPWAVGTVLAAIAIKETLRSKPWQ